MTTQIAVCICGSTPCWLNRKGTRTRITVGSAKRALRLFNQKVDTVLRSRFKQMAFGEGMGFKLEFEPNGVHVEKRGADEDARLALATTLRFLVQPGDQISFCHIAELYDHLLFTSRASRSTSIPFAIP
jgi:hypothetical protein